jgi:phosphate starvation-inducible protein PhoH
MEEEDKWIHTRSKADDIEAKYTALLNTLERRTSFHELDSVITRVGKDSKLIFCGDYTQSDFTKVEERQGCISFMKILKQMPSFTFIEFGVEDIVRSALVREYIINKYKLGLNVS